MFLPVDIPCCCGRHQRRPVEEPFFPFPLVTNISAIQATKRPVQEVKRDGWAELVMPSYFPLPGTGARHGHLAPFRKISCPEKFAGASGKGVSP